ncbi:MAG: dihydroorotate dehydrogenase (quinone) [Bacteroidetes bacterium GWF2_49_14]|nr:MAG: dihydroorotate dehydrogenase (quinone) [Bacteroidetes bacterium GWF2_49_14]HBB91770.1 dihydroorotate dehydrogenase (quinone) [Bacteroidales bacterium]
MFYQKLLRPILFLFSAETIHKILFFFFRLLPSTGYFFRLVHRPVYFNQRVEAFGLKFKHPVGIAGGLDKNARAIRFLRNMGFAFVEIGTVTPLPQGGNPKPRLFRLTRSSALINRMGFNNEGLDVIAKRLRNRPKDLIIGGNIGKNTTTPNEKAVEDFAVCFEGLYPYVDYFVVNVSCPNIKDLSKLQNKDDLSRILNRLLAIRLNQGIVKPVLLKISPDLSEIQLDEVIEVVRETRIDGLVATNTSIRRFNLDYRDDYIASLGQGGLSGSPLREVSTEIIRYLHQRLGRDFPIIGSGGLMNEDDANEKLDAGATLVQLYTGFIYEGPGLLSRILKSLAKKS